MSSTTVSGGDAQQIIAEFLAALDLIQVLQPQIENLIQSGEVSVEDQAKVKAKSEFLRDPSKAYPIGDPDWSNPDGTPSKSQLP